MFDEETLNRMRNARLEIWEKAAEESLRTAVENMGLDHVKIIQNVEPILENTNPVCDGTEMDLNG